MSKMIPPRFDPQASNAERKVYERLGTDPATAEWTVLHSLCLSRRGKKPYGEIDFVVLVPGGGLFCLEVKGGRVRCENGVWYTQDGSGNEHELKRSPFTQAREGMFEIRKVLDRHFGENDPVLKMITGYAVVLPDVQAPPGTTEFESWEVMDVDDLRQPISRAIQRMISSQQAKLGSISSSSSATPENLNRIRHLLRPDFDVAIARSTVINRSEERLVRLTEEQFDVLDMVASNQRCLIDGAAGTGKTLLALEYAKRSAQAGKQTALLCFNRLLGDWLAEQAASYGLNNLLAGNYHQYMRRVILASPFADEFRNVEYRNDGKVFSEAYPYYAELALSERDHVIDVLILDEAQDLIQAPILDVLNTWLLGGLAGGEWAFFGDFTRQSIFGAAVSRPGLDAALPIIEAYADPAGLKLTKAPLRLNCRNTRQIGEETALLSGFESLPYRLDRSEGLPVDYRYWKSREDQLAKLKDVLQILQRDGVKASDVVLLSPVSFDRSVAGLLRDDRELRANEIIPGGAPVKKGSIAFCTIQAFKGMESAVVILCDINALEPGESQSLLYVGMSRARSHLVILAHDQLRQSIGHFVAAKLKQSWLT